ncbi:hypothetical protein ACWJJH_11620 [Endozoicomonadaceae bacterium StTr2]
MISTGRGWLVAVLLMLTCQASWAFQGKVATTLPITQALAKDLLQETGINVTYLPPKRLPVKRSGHWLAHKSSDSVKKAGPFDAVITIESVWPGHAAYSKLRTHNIRVVAIDIARELSAPGRQVHLSRDALQQQHYFWLSPDNLLVMTQILATDLARLWPQHAAMIQRNEKRLNQQIQHYSLEVEKLLLARDIEALCVHSQELMPQASATFLLLEAPGDCSPDALHLQKFRAGQKDTPQTWKLDSAEKPLKTDIAGWLNANLTRLDQAVRIDN